MRSMAGAERVFLLLCVAAAALPLLVQGYIPIQTYRRGHPDTSTAADVWSRSSTTGEAGDVQPVHRPFKHRFVHRPNKSLLEHKEGESHGFEIHPQWERRFHGQHHGGNEDFRLAGEHHRHKHDHAHFREHHGGGVVPERMMLGDGVGDHNVDARLSEQQAKSQPEVMQVTESSSSSGVWEKLKTTVGDSVSGLAVKLQSVGDGIKNWLSPSKSRVAPTISFSAEPAWLGRLVAEPAKPAASGPCSLDTKLGQLMDGVLKNDYSSSESQTTCAGMLDGRTKLLKVSLMHELKALCSGNLDTPCDLQFCDFFNRHARWAVTMLLSKFEVNPVDVALKHETSSLCTEKDTTDILHHISHLTRRLHLHTSSLSTGITPEGTDSCQVCFDQSFRQLRHGVKDRLVQLCEKATCPKLRDSCAFVKEHKHLSHTLFTLKLRPWEIAADSCASSCVTTPFPDILSSSRVQKLQFGEETKEMIPLGGENNFFPLRHQGPQLGTGCHRRAMRLRGFEARQLGDLSRILEMVHADSDGIPHLHFMVVEFARHRPDDVMQQAQAARGEDSVALGQEIQARLTKQFKYGLARVKKAMVEPTDVVDELPALVRPVEDVEHNDS